jgi:hypothetical protein
MMLPHKVLCNGLCVIVCADKQLIFATVPQRNVHNEHWRAATPANDRALRGASFRLELAAPCQQLLLLVLQQQPPVLCEELLRFARDGICLVLEDCQRTLPQLL